MTRHLQWLLALGCLLPPGAACLAAGIPMAVSPVSVKLEIASEYAGVNVSNRGEEATGVQAEILLVRWVAGQEQYEPTSDFVVSPPAFRLQAGKDRMVRFRYSGPRENTERFYRLFVRQLPETSTAGQVNMVFNLGIPIFVAPHQSRPGLSLAGTSGGAGAELHNTGNVTLSVAHLEGKGCPSGPQKVASRLAPGQKFVLRADSPLCATAAQTDRGLIPLATP
ncbi:MULTISPECIES: molecular chaperone [unclassified Polaromonas]|uniref:fimbrial biogenesis chaperone n=1 Tax=unclassified Polaromonas TaxID=2638319 RepID=UPI000F075D16|nr:MULTISPECIES: fimbria/pilus periplasmic chaperone [unclassified Polaromonas]AYQ28962.1 molecular chaperone [Polaromonas sp. SP1]QGJ19920.1 fimbria/pilus periplasmic chaperone [Polaromonas sp. Pch-P]